MLLALLLAAVAPIPGAAQEHSPVVNERVADEATKAASTLCAALQGKDPARLEAALAPGFRARGLEAGPEDDAPAFLAQLQRRAAPAVLVRRCSFKPFQFTTDAAHARAVGRFQLVFSGLDREGQRFSDRGDVEVALQREGRELKLAELEFLPRVWKSGGVPEFHDATAEAGLLPGLGQIEQYVGLAPFLLENGGVAIGDYDNDGLPDIYVPATGRNLLFHNDGHGRFTEVAVKAGVAGAGGNGRSALWVDLDNDGDLDLFVANAVFDHAGPAHGPGARSGGNRLFRNDGHGHFTDITRSAGVGQVGFFSSVVAADVDGDGLLDLFVGQYQDRTIPRNPLLAHNGQPSLLLHNLGHLRFEEVGQKVGVAGHEWTLAAALADLDGDRKPELVVVNDYGSPRLYHNASRGPGDVAFEEITTQAGVVDPGNGMGIDVADVDGDGRPDLYLTKMFSKAGNRLLSLNPSSDPKTLEVAQHGARGNSLFRNLGGLKFQEVADEAGVRRAGWAWSCEFGDVDNDGRQDLYVANGFLTGPSEDDL